MQDSKTWNHLVTLVLNEKVFDGEAPGLEFME